MQFVSGDFEELFIALSGLSHYFIKGRPEEDRSQFTEESPGWSRCSVNISEKILNELVTPEGILYKTRFSSDNVKLLNYTR